VAILCEMAKAIALPQIPKQLLFFIT